MKNPIFIILISFILNGLGLCAQVEESPTQYKLGNFKSVFGEYKRNQITDATDFSSRIVGQIEANFGVSDTICTGTLIGPKVVITAAHCVYDKDSSTWATNVTFTPARTGPNNRPYGVVKATKFFVNKNYTDKQVYWGFDYAVIELDTPIGNQLGFAEIEIPNFPTQKINIQIMGYPGDKDYGTLWNVNCIARKINLEEWNYRCDTYGGMSGSAIRSKDHLDKIIGIHTYGNDEENGGWIITQDMFDDLTLWKSGKLNLETSETHLNYFLPKMKYNKIHFKNNCETSVKIYAHFMNLDGKWVTDGSWEISPSNSSYMFNTTNSFFYFYGKTNEVENWKGDFAFSLDNVSYPMELYKFTSDEIGNVTVDLFCSR